MYLDRNEAIKTIRKELKRKTGKTWSVTGGRGTARGWIRVEAPPKRRVNHVKNPAATWELSSRQDEPLFFDEAPREGETGIYTSQVECKELADAFGLTKPVHFQGLSISPDGREYYVGLLLQETEEG